MESPKKERLYHIWKLMVGRCHNPNWVNWSTAHYRDKGIIVCDEWRYDYQKFKTWAISHGYADNLTIDRIDSNGNYCPENCQWLSASENTIKANKERKGRKYKKSRC